MKLKRSHYTSIIRNVDVINVMKDNNHIPSLLGRRKNSIKISCVYIGLLFTHKYEGPVSHKISLPSSSVQCFKDHSKSAFLHFCQVNLNTFWVSSYTILDCLQLWHVFLIPKTAFNLLMGPPTHHLTLFDKYFDKLTLSRAES